jgi:hypothetical protein
VRQLAGVEDELVELLVELVDVEVLELEVLDVLAVELVEEELLEESDVVVPDDFPRESVR